MEDFEDWYRELRPPMQVALATWCGDAPLASDALDEAFVRALERWSRVRDLDSPAGWVWRTATNQVRRLTRRRAHEQRLLASVSAGAHRAVESTGDDLDLRRAIASLSDRQRAAVVLYYLADLSVRDVAAAMGVATGTVDATLHHARARLHGLLAEPAAAPAPTPSTEGGRR